MPHNNTINTTDSKSLTG